MYDREMLCQKCQEIPLDIFLPNIACTQTVPGGNLWLGKHLHSTFDKIEQSSTNGCIMCRLCLGALKNGQSVGAIPAKEGLRGMDVTLSCSNEGEVLVLEHTGTYVVRKGCLRWFNEDMKQGRQPGHIISNSPNAPQVFALAVSWIETCRKDHQACNMNPKADYYPTRLLDIGFPSPGEDPMPRLVRTASRCKAGNIEYLALSHCWGTALGAHIPRTTKATLTARQSCIHWDELSKTFQDAIKITQGLGVRYIWIDALCIVQDDQEDFEIECAKMAMVYSNAYCTIAASDSPTGNGGCFIPRDDKVIQGCTLLSRNTYKIVQSRSLMDVNRGRDRSEPASATVRIHRNYVSFQDSIEGPLSKRGWTLQERELSPRILYYTKDQVLWECRQCTASEESPMFKRKDDIQVNDRDRRDWHDDQFTIVSSKNCTSRDELMTNQPSLRLLDGGFDARSDTICSADAIFKKWYALTEAYSCRQLSVKRDKLPAISGIAAEVACLLQSDDYLAGIWKTDLLRGISWFPDPINRRVCDKTWPPLPIDEGIPSWSWAAFDGPIKYYGENWFGDDRVNTPSKIHLEAVHIIHASRDPFGRVASGELRLSGLAIEASVSEMQHQSDFRGSGFQAKCYSLSTSFKNPPTLRLYFDSDPMTLPRIDIVCLQLGSGLSVRKTWADVGLVLLKDNHANDVYHRVGMFDVEAVDKKWRSLREEQMLRIR